MYFSCDLFVSLCNSSSKMGIDFCTKGIQKAALLKMSSSQFFLYKRTILFLRAWRSPLNANQQYQIVDVGNRLPYKVCSEALIQEHRFEVQTDLFASLFKMPNR